MITKEQALENALKYIKKRNRNYDLMDKNKILFEENVIIPYGKYNELKKSIYTIICENEGYLDPISHFVAVDAETGEVLFTATPHGYAEDWEE